MNFHLLTEIAIKLFFMLTPFFVLSMFVTITADMPTPQRKSIAKRATLGIICVCLILYFFGRQLFQIFGITIDSFRIGAGIILLLTAIDQVRGPSRNSVKSIDAKPSDDIAIVPLTIPYVVGPGTIGMLLVLGGDPLPYTDRFVAAIGIALAGLATGSMLYFSDFLMRHLGNHTLQVLSKITGLILAAISAQSFMTGAIALWNSH